MGKLHFTQSSIINTSSSQFCIVGSVSLCLKHFAPFPPFLPRTFHLTCASVSFLYWNTFSCVHAHTINQTPPAQQTHFTILCTDMRIYVCIYICVCSCTCRHITGRGTEWWKFYGRPTRQYKCALKPIYSLPKIYPFLLLFQWYDMFYWTTFLVDVIPFLGQDGKNYPALHMLRRTNHAKAI